MSALVTINLVVYNGEKYIRHCLDSVKKQTYENIEVNIWDNGSTDKTLEIIENWKISAGGGSASGGENGNFNLIKSKVNLGMWPAHEELWKTNNGKYVVVLSVDVILDPDFVKNAVEVMEEDEKIGALQAKIFQWHIEQNKRLVFSDIIDTLGFKIERSRRVTNIGHGIKESELMNIISYDKIFISGEVFGVEGAAPIFRRMALEDCRILGKIIDDKMFWYGDDLDLAWRMRIFGWKQVYAPKVIAYHDRSTTKSLKNSFADFVRIRKQIPMFKRRFDWRNTTLTIIKNDYAINLLKDFPYIFWRQFKLWVYFLFFEPAMFLEIFSVAKLLPNMLKKRRAIMKKARVSAKEMRKWFE